MQTLKAKSFKGRFLHLSKYNNILTILKYLLLSAFCKIRGVSREVNLIICEGVTLKIRLGSTDLESAIDCLVDDELSLTFIASELSSKRNVKIIDCGGYIGASALALCKKYPNSEVVVIEADPANYVILTENLRNLSNVHLVNAVFTSEENSNDYVEFFRGENGKWSSSAIKSNSSNELIGTIKTITLSKILSDYGWEGVDILKMDIEGGEAQFLRGQRPLERVAVLAIELHNSECEAAYQIATKDRFNMKGAGEKHFSFRSDIRIEPLHQG